MSSIFIILAVLWLFTQVSICAQPISTKGQFWSSGLTGSDVPVNQSSFESTIGYTPTLSLYRELNADRLLDIEWAYRFDRSYSGDSLFSNNEKNHRLWIRYSSEKLEARLGLQKIVFGPSQILRTLSWFDTIDLKDPTGQTDGVEAFRLRWFPSNLLSVWSWVIQDKNETLSFGGRTELSADIGEWGFTVHHDPSDSLQTVGQTGALIDQPHNRVAIDYRYDGFIGFWNESAVIFSNNTQITMYTIGADYTLPVAGGILMMTESMYINNPKTKSNQKFTAFMASMPFGMINQLMLITQIDWEENHTYNYVRWSATYDRFSLNFIVSKSPKRVDYAIPVQELPNTIAGFGTGFQFMFIYNH